MSKTVEKLRDVLGDSSFPTEKSKYYEAIRVLSPNDRIGQAERDYLEFHLPKLQNAHYLNHVREIERIVRDFQVSVSLNGINNGILHRYVETSKQLLSFLESIHHEFGISHNKELVWTWLLLKFIVEGNYHVITNIASFFKCDVLFIPNRGGDDYTTVYRIEDNFDPNDEQYPARLERLDQHLRYSSGIFVLRVRGESFEDTSVVLHRKDRVGWTFLQAIRPYHAENLPKLSKYAPWLDWCDSTPHPSAMSGSLFRPYLHNANSLTLNRDIDFMSLPTWAVFANMIGLIDDDKCWKMSSACIARLKHLYSVNPGDNEVRRRQTTTLERVNSLETIARHVSNTTLRALADLNKPVHS